MIYTVGLVADYEPRIDAGTAIKGGRRPDYEGGWVWETVAAAQAFLAERKSEHNRRVYGVLADWDLDALPVEGQTYRTLIKPAVIVRLTPAATPG